MLSSTKTRATWPDIRGATSREDFDQRRQDIRVAEASVSQAREEVYQVRSSLGLPPQPEKGKDLSDVPPDLEETFSDVRAAFSDLVQTMAALGVARSGLPVEAYRQGPRHVYVELPSEADVAALKPDQRALAGLGIGVSTFAGRGLAWKTRMFAPYHGVAEDPATGSAAGPLAVHLARHGRIGFGDEIEIRQGEEIGRPSRLYARAEGSADKVERVLVGGSAVIVARGEYRLS